MRVVERSRFETRVRVRTMGIKVPRSPTAPESSDTRLCLRRPGRWLWWTRGVVMVGACCRCSSMEWW